MSARKSAWDKKNRPSSQVQSVLIDRNNFTKRQANAWIKKEGFINRKVDITKNLYRYRQLPPGKFDQESFRTKKIRDGVQLVIGIPLKNKKRGSGNIEVFGSMFKMPKTKIKIKKNKGDAKKYTPVLKKIAKNASKYYKTDVDWKILREPMSRGIAAWRTGHRTGANSFQWGYARVYSFLVGGKAFFTSETDVAKELPKKLYNKIMEEAVWSDIKSKPEKIIRDRDGNKINPRYYAGLNAKQRSARIKELNQRNRELKKYEKSGRKLTVAQKKKLNRPFKTDRFLKTKPSTYTVEARKRGIATSS